MNSIKHIKSFFDSCTRNWKGIKVKPPLFKSRKSKQTSRFVGANYQVDKSQIYLPKVGRITAFFMPVDHSRDALMQRPYKVLVMAMWFINLKSVVR